jgi:hypothetical protein
MTTELSTSVRQISRPALAVTALIGVLLAATAALWVHFGTAVFYEMIVAGIATCL